MCVCVCWGGGISCGLKKKVRKISTVNIAADIAKRFKFRRDGEKGGRVKKKYLSGWKFLANHVIETFYILHIKKNCIEQH